MTEPTRERGASSVRSHVRQYLAFTRGTGAIPELDGLRALAILLVLARHGARPYWDGVGSLLPVAGWDLGVPLINGWVGVDLFFVLSGFLITHHVVSRYGDGFGRRDVGDYMLRRVLRIVPLYFVVLLVAAWGLFPLYEVPAGALRLRVAYHMLFLQDYLPSNIIVVFWSLGVEEKFYLLAPVVMMAVFRVSGQRRYAALLALAALPSVLRYWTMLRHPEVTEYAPFFTVFRSPFHLTFDGLVLGAVCALVFRDVRAAGGPRPGSHVAPGLFWAGALGLGWLLCAQPLLDSIGWFDKVLLEAVLAVCVAGVLLGLTLGGGPCAWFRKDWLFFFSKISYSLYLVHYPMVPVAQWIVGWLPGAAGAAPAVQFVLFLPFYVGLSIAVALVFHYAVEKPFLVVKDRLPKPKRVPSRAPVLATVSETAP